MIKPFTYSPQVLNSMASALQEVAGRLSGMELASMVGQAAALIDSAQVEALHQHLEGYDLPATPEVIQQLAFGYGMGPSRHGMTHVLLDPDKVAAMIEALSSVTSIGQGHQIREQRARQTRKARLGAIQTQIEALLEQRYQLLEGVYYIDMGDRRYSPWLQTELEQELRRLSEEYAGVEWEKPDSANLQALYESVLDTLRRGRKPGEIWSRHLAANPVSRQLALDYALRCGRENFLSKIHYAIKDLLKTCEALQRAVTALNEQLASDQAGTDEYSLVGLRLGHRLYDTRVAFKKARSNVMLNLAEGFEANVTLSAAAEALMLHVVHDETTYQEVKPVPPVLEGARAMRGKLFLPQLFLRAFAELRNRIERETGHRDETVHPLEHYAREEFRKLREEYPNTIFAAVDDSQEEMEIPNPPPTKNPIILARWLDDVTDYLKKRYENSNYADNFILVLRHLCNSLAKDQDRDLETVIQIEDRHDEDGNRHVVVSMYGEQVRSISIPRLGLTGVSKVKQDELEAALHRYVSS